VQLRNRHVELVLVRVFDEQELTRFGNAAFAEIELDQTAVAPDACWTCTTGSPERSSDRSRSIPSTELTDLRSRAARERAVPA